MKRILMVLNKPNRELGIMNAVKREILAQQPDALVEIIPYADGFFEAVEAFEPDVMMTFPMTSISLAEPYYVFKRLFGTRVVCYRAEGILDPGSSHSVANHVGYDRYGPMLVDAEIFWGPGPSKIIGDALLAARKLSSADRAKCFGYARLERYFGRPLPDTAELPARVSAKLAAWPRARTLLFATGFHFANYTRETIFAAKDLDAENRCDELLGIIEEVKRFRAAWIDAVRRAASEQPDLLFVLKKHPIERCEDYRALEGIPNILYVWEDVDIGDLIERSGVFFHYGSTALADAYLSDVPAVYVYSRETRCHAWYPDLGWPSARSVAVDDVPAVAREFGAGHVVHDAHDAKVKQVLEFNFNIREGEPYEPSRQLAEFLLRDEEAQRPSILDPYMWRALLYYHYRRLRRTLGRPVRRMLMSMRSRIQR